MPKKRSIACKCLECGKDFLAIPFEIKRGGGKFCSRICQRREATRHTKTPDGWRARSSAKRKGIWRFKDRAREAVKRALKTGLLIKAPACNYCESPARLDAHHFDYTKPYDVIWLCRKCHLQEHRRFQNNQFRPAP